MAVPPSTVNSVRCRPGAMVITYQNATTQDTTTNSQISGHYTMTGIHFNYTDLGPPLPLPEIRICVSPLSA